MLAIFSALAPIFESLFKALIPALFGLAKDTADEGTPKVGSQLRRDGDDLVAEFVRNASRGAAQG